MVNESLFKNKRSSSPKDLYIANKLRQRRTELGLSQLYLAETLGITAQQLSKYEKGIDRIPAGRLDDFAKGLSVPISFFYKDGDNKTPSLQPKDFSISCTHLKGKKIKLTSLKLKAILTDIKTQQEYELEIF